MTAPSYFKTYAAADFDLQQPADVAVIMPTVIRPTMKEALQSVFRQAPVRRIQILIGIDRPDGDAGLIEAICAERPAHCCVNVVYPGYSTSARYGGLHPAYDGGVLRCVLTYLANSRYVAGRPVDADQNLDAARRRLPEHRLQRLFHGRADDGRHDDGNVDGPLPIEIRGRVGFEIGRCCHGFRR